jgi:hypothetical protein
MLADQLQLAADPGLPAQPALYFGMGERVLGSLNVARRQRFQPHHCRHRSSSGWRRSASQASSRCRPRM